MQSHITDGLMRAIYPLIEKEPHNPLNAELSLYAECNSHQPLLFFQGHPSIYQLTLITLQGLNGSYALSPFKSTRSLCRDEKAEKEKSSLKKLMTLRPRPNADVSLMISYHMAHSVHVC